MAVTSNIPLAYAVKVNASIHLYILIYGSEEMPKFNVGMPSGKTILYKIDKMGDGQFKHFKHYDFPAGIYSDIKIVCDGHERKIETADIIEGPLPASQADERAFDVPYAYTQKVLNDKDRFTVELVFIPSSPKKLSCSHFPPPNQTGPDSNTRSTISETGTVVPILEERAIFMVPDFYNDETDNGHTVEYTGNPRRRGKTKNRNHSPTPFPRKKPKKNT